MEENIEDENLLNDEPDTLDQSKQIDKDRYKFTYITFFLLGIGTLLPYNFFIIASKYFNYKFRPLSNDSSIINNLNETTSYLQISFVNISNISANISSTILITLNTIYAHKININRRFYTTGVFIFILFVITTILAKINTDSWQYVFYLLTIVTIILLNANAAVYGCAVYGYASVLPPIYTQAICMGQVASGLVTTIIQILTNLSLPDPIENGLLFFSIGCFVILLDLVCFTYARKTKFFKYYQNKKNAHLRNENINTDNVITTTTVDNSTDLTPLISDSNVTVQPFSLSWQIFSIVFKSSWYYLSALYFINIITSSLYPGVAAAVKSANNNKSRFSTDFFLPVMFLLQNLSDMMGRILCGMAPLAIHRRALIGFLSFIRIILIPLYIFCNIQPRFTQNLVYFGDVTFYSFVTLNGFSNGYLATICLMHIPKLVDTSLSELVSSLAQLVLLLGISFGAIISFIITSFI